MAKAVDCKSTIPGSNPGGASLKAATLNRVAAFLCAVALAIFRWQISIQPSLPSIATATSQVARRKWHAEFLRQTDDLDYAQGALQSALNTAQTIAAKRRRSGSKNSVIGLRKLRSDRSPDASF